MDRVIEVRVAAIRAFSQLGFSDVNEVLSVFLDDPNRAMAEAARQSLALYR